MRRHLVIVAGGTGGHIMPGLAVAEEMRRRGWSVSWVGTRHGMEHRLVPSAGIEIDALDFAGLRGKGVAGAWRGLWQLLRALSQGWAILRRRQASAVLGMGGYVCVPAGVMAAMQGRPLFLVNADAALLLSNRILLPFARMMACGFDGPAAQHARARVTGNPVRAAIAALAPPEQRYAQRLGPLRVLVVGGSLGARVLNEVLPKALALMAAAQRPIVSHQTGMAHFDEVKAAYAAAGLALHSQGASAAGQAGDIELLPFINDMPARLAQCDLVLCRSGAVTVSELCAAGVASMLVPLVVSTTAHQRDNAQYMAAHGAAMYLPQTELTAQSLAQQLGQLSRERLSAMATRARTLARHDAAAAVADAIEQSLSPFTQDRPA